VFPTATGTVSDDSTTITLVDTSKNWVPGQWKGYAVSDNTQNMQTTLLDNDPDTLIFAAPMGAPPLAGDEYLIAPGAALMTLELAKGIVNEAIAVASLSLYNFAVYNLAADRLFNYAPDIRGQTFFKDQRIKLNLATSRFGVVSGSGDQGSYTNLLNPEAMKRFTLRDLQMLKTPWGREYMGIAQMYGPTVWGLT
jgi:hypothetical protein